MSKADQLPPVTLEQIDALLPFRQRFEEAGASVGTWKALDTIMPWFDYNKLVSEFVSVLYRMEWVAGGFDWPRWQRKAKRYVETATLIETADAGTILKLFTTHVRADRFNEGHLAQMVSTGHVLALLRRLEVIRKEMTHTAG